MYQKVIFAKAFGVSLGVLLLIAAIGVYGGLAYAVPVAGVGTYTTAADDINASEVVVHPQVEGDDQAIAVVELRDTEIDGLTITKDVGNYELEITADQTVESEQMLIKAETIDAEGSNVFGAEVDANTVGESDREFEVRSGAQQVEEGPQGVDAAVHAIEGAEEPSLYLENFEIETHYLVTNEISIPDLSISIGESGGSGDEGASEDSEGG